MYESPYHMLGAVLEDDELGARRYAGPSRGAMTVRDHRLAKAQRVAQELTRPAPGVPGVQGALLALGFTTIQFVNAGATTLSVTSTPQKPFRGQRLVVDLARTAAATQLITITRFLMGAVNVLPSGDPIGVAGFAATAFQTMLDLVPVSSGDIITIDYTTSAAPGVGETIDISTTLFGPSLLG